MINKKIKLLIANNDFIVGGVQKLIIDQINGLDKERFDISVVTLFQFPDKGDFYNLIPDKIPVYKLNFKSIYDLKEWIKLIAILRKNKPDIISTGLFFSNTVFGVLKPLFGYKLITANHNTDTRRKLYAFIDRILSIFSYKIVTDSEGVADFVSIAENINRDRFRVIYNGVELEKIEASKKELMNDRPRIRSKMGIQSKDFVFLNVARMTKQKNQKLLISAFGNLLKKVQNVKLIMIGDGSLRWELENQVKKLGIQNKVIFPGEIQDLYKHYIVSDCFILTSLREGFCIAAMDGLAFGLPLVSTRVAGVSEYLKDGENGFFVESDVDDISNKMNMVINLEPAHLNAIKKQATETAGRFGVKKYVKSFENLYEECLGYPFK